MLRRGPRVHLVAPFFCVLGHPSDTASVKAVSVSSPGQAFSTAFHFRLAPLEWFCCRQTVLWILGLEWAVTFCNWKFITQRQFHWALSLFNTQSLEYCGSCGFRWHYLYCPHVLSYEGGLFSSLGCSLLSPFSFAGIKICPYSLPLIFYPRLYQACALVKPWPACKNWYQWTNKIMIKTGLEACVRG